MESTEYLTIQRDGALAIARVAKRQQSALEAAARAEENDLAREFLLALSKQMGERWTEFSAQALETDRRLRQRADDPGVPR